jgi:hypothetical protein
MKWLKHSAIVGTCVLTVLLFVGSASTAEAANCAAGAICTVNLTNTNIIGNPAGLINIAVTINNTGATTVLTVAFVSSNLSNTPLGIDVFAYNSSALATTLPKGWKQTDPKGSPFQEDGFGLFTSELTSPGGTDLSASFTLASLVTTFTENANLGEFAAHIRFSNECSLWASDGTSNMTSPLGGCGVTTPEPTLLGMLGIGLLGMGIFFGRLRRIHQSNR